MDLEIAGEAMAAIMIARDAAIASITAGLAKNCFATILLPSNIEI